MVPPKLHALHEDCRLFGCFCSRKGPQMRTLSRLSPA
jgi:hypothetical protein